MLSRKNGVQKGFENTPNSHTDLTVVINSFSNCRKKSVGEELQKPVRGLSQVNSRKSLAKANLKSGKNTDSGIGNSKTGNSVEKSKKKNSSMKLASEGIFGKKKQSSSNSILENQILNLKKQLKNLKQIQKQDKYLIFEPKSDEENSLKEEFKPVKGKSKEIAKRVLTTGLSSSKKLGFFHEKRESKCQKTKTGLQSSDNLNMNFKLVGLKPKKQQRILNKKLIEKNATQKIGEILLQEKEKQVGLERSTSKTNITSLKKNKAPKFAEDEQTTDDHHRYEEVEDERDKGNIRESTSKAKLLKHKIKPKKKEEPMLVRSKNKNSLQDLLEQYNKLKQEKKKDQNEIEVSKLRKMKLKLNSIQTLLDKKLKNVEGNKLPTKSKQENAVIVIQKYARGFLVRKFLRNYVLATNPTFESFEIQKGDKFCTKSSIVSEDEIEKKWTKESLKKKKTHFGFPSQENVEFEDTALRKVQERQGTFKGGKDNKLGMSDLRKEVGLKHDKEEGDLKNEEQKIGYKEFRDNNNWRHAKKENEEMTEKKEEKFKLEMLNKFSLTNPMKTPGTIVLEDGKNKQTQESQKRKKTENLGNKEAINKKEISNKGNVVSVKNSIKEMTELCPSPKKEQAIEDGFKVSQKIEKKPFPKKTIFQWKDKSRNERETQIIPIEKLITKECQNWECLGEALRELNSIITSKKQTDTKFNSVIEKINTMTTDNIKTLKQVLKSPVSISDFNYFPKQDFEQEKRENQDWLEKSQNNLNSIQKTAGRIPCNPRMLCSRSKSKLNEDGELSRQTSLKIGKKFGMEVWPENELIKSNMKQWGNLGGSNSLYFDKLSEADDKFFYTERESSIAPKQEIKCQETVSRDASKTSFETKHGGMTTGNQRVVSDSKESLKGLENKSNSKKELLTENKASLVESKQLNLIGGINLNQFIPDRISPLSRHFINESFSNFDIKKIDQNYKTGLQSKKSSNDLEFIEVPLESSLKESTNVTLCGEFMLEYLLYDLVEEPIWHDSVAGLNLKDRDQTQMEDNIYGIRTNISAVNEYCNLLVSYLEENNPEKLQVRVDEYITVISNKNQSVVELELSLLEFADERQAQGWCRKTPPMTLLSETDYLELEEQILENYKHMNILDELFDMQRVYHRCIFDSFNEILSLMIMGSRKYRLQGKERHLLEDECTFEKLKGLLMKSRNMLLENTLLLCGLIRDKEDSMMGKSVKNFDLDSIKIIREERLMRMLAGELAVEEGFWGDKKGLMKEQDGFVRDFSLEIEKYLFRDLAQFLKG